MIFVLFYPYAPLEYMITDEFLYNSSFLYKVFYIHLSGKIYTTTFFLLFSNNEAVCIASGIGYNGKDKEGNYRWDGTPCGEGYK